jgi:hypothetical protein
MKQAVEAAARIHDVVGRMQRITKLELMERPSRDLPETLDLAWSSERPRTQ